MQKGISTINRPKKDRYIGRYIVLIRRGVAGNFLRVKEIIRLGSILPVPTT